MNRAMRRIENRGKVENQERREEMGMENAMLCKRKAKSVEERMKENYPKVVSMLKAQAMPNITSNILNAKFNEIAYKARAVDGDLSGWLEAMVLNENFIADETESLYVATRKIILTKAFSNSEVLEIAKNMAGIYATAIITYAQERYTESWVYQTIYKLKCYELSVASANRLAVITDLLLPKEFQQHLEMLLILFSCEPEECIKKLESMGVFN